MSNDIYKETHMGPDGPVEREAEREERESEHADDADIADRMADDWFLDPINWDEQ